MLEPILKGLVEWIYEMMLDIMAYASGELLGVMSMDLSYFERTAPVITDIVNVFIALGWALLIGNLVFQSLKAMMSGAGFEAEDPKLIFLRTFVFAFLLLASRQICDICSGITGTVIDMLQMPTSIIVTTPDESMFSLGAGAKWLLVIIVGVVLMVQMVKLLFEIGERYVITSVLTFFAPLAFAMGGSKNTNDIFKGWCRMYGSMLVMMIMNIVFLKLIMSAMSQMNSGGVLIWLVFVVALTRVARKIDSHIGKIGLNPAQTGAGIGSRIPGMMTMVAVRTMGSLVSRSMASAKGGSGGRSGRNGNFSGRNRSANPTGSRFRSAYSGDGHTTNMGRENNISNTGSHAAYNGYSSGGANVNNAGGVNIGGANISGMNNGIASVNADLTGNTAKPASSASSGGMKPHVVRGGSFGSVNSSNYAENQQNSGGVNMVQNRTVAHGRNTMRPPLPRNTAGVNPSAENPMNSIIQSSMQNTGSVNSGKSLDVHKSGTSIISAPIQSGSVNQSVSGSVSKNGNKAISSSEAVQNRSDVKGSRTNVGNISGGNVHSTEIGGNAGSVNMGRVNLGGNTQMYSDRFEQNNTEHRFENRNNRFNEVHQKSEMAQQRVNHEYKHGKFNPAAANKKVKKSYYQKENLQQRYRKEREHRKNWGDNNRKRKQ